VSLAHTVAALKEILLLSQIAVFGKAKTFLAIIAKKIIVNIVATRHPKNDSETIYIEVLQQAI
jgi:hypothetical protein